MNQLVLVTDADRRVADLFLKFLARLGYLTDGASDGIECLEKVRRFKPDVVVLDRELLWGGGDGVLECLSAEAQESRPAVVLTTRATDGPAEHLTAPVAACLQKPFGLSQLLKSIAAARQQRAGTQRTHDTVGIRRRRTRGSFRLIQSPQSSSPMTMKPSAPF